MRKSDFALFDQQPDLVYLDSAATCLRPRAVVDKLAYFYNYQSANVHRGSYDLSDLATTEYELAREKVRCFINASTSEEIIFTKGTTESINLVAQGMDSVVQEGDLVVVSQLEHHANLVPWQQLCLRTGAHLRAIPLDADFNLDLSVLSEWPLERVKVLAISGGSNILGTLPNVKQIISKIKEGNPEALCLVDAAQLVTLGPVDVQDLDCDFLTFSGHKLWGPFGIGVLFGKKSALEDLPPYQYGGSMIKKVESARSTFNDLPFKFEAGTPPVAEAVGLGAALDYASQIGWDVIQQHKHSLTLSALKQLQALNLEIFGQSHHRTSLVAFNIPKAHHSDVGQILNEKKIAIRVGHHCAQPLMSHLHVTGTLRASFSIHNTEADILQLISALRKAQTMLVG